MVDAKANLVRPDTRIIRNEYDRNGMIVVMEIELEARCIQRVGIGSGGSS